MDLLLGVEPGGSTPRFDVRVSVASSHVGADVAHALADYCGLPRADRLSVRRGGRYEPLDIEATVEDLGLVSGDVVALNPPARRARREADDSHLRVAVTFGPDAGSSHDLYPGDHTVGRSTECTVTIADPQFSRHQLTIALDGGEEAGPETSTVTLTPEPSAVNETRINGTIVSEPTELLIDDVVQVGATSFTLRRSKPAVERSLDFFGGVPFHRTPYFWEPVPEQELPALKDLPVKPDARRFQYLGAVMPLFMGIAMAFMIGNMRFLLFAAMSPVMVIGSWFDHRKHSGKDFEESVERFEERLAERADEIDRALQIERVSRYQNGPDIELLANRAENRHSELWLRDREAEDFLSVRIGVGTVSPQLNIKPDDSGDRQFREQVEALIERADQLVDVPVTLDLAGIGTAGLVGDAEDTEALTCAILLQACCLHSPEDLVVMAALPHRSGLNEWLKWMPHARSSSSPLAGEHLVGTPDETNDLIRALVKIAEQRVEKKNDQLDRRWPWLLVAIDRSLEPDAGAISRLLDLCPEAGISVVWLTDSRARVPRQAQAVLDCRSAATGEMSALRHTDPEVASQDLDVERVSEHIATDVAQWLAPMRDASAANAATSIPRMVPLFASLGVEEMTPEWIAGEWATDRGYSLVAPIGMTDVGPLELDLVEHGPHGLIGGTSGAGKSELVQSLVVNLMAKNSPKRINFLFVDYKGGALSEMFKDVPHSVGAVTNLDALLALRALTSLTAELDRRMELFKGRAQDIKDMLNKFPDEAPPSLVIVVDEFAALVRELPDFVDGIVSIAERGRSLGIHLIMSTQRPSGAINDNIQQNTNLRIALRMLDSGESRNVIGSTEAALIPGPLKGRGFARLGPGELIAFQSAWSGAPLQAAAGRPPVSVKPFSVAPVANPNGAPGPAKAAGGESDGPERTQLDATIAAIIEAAENLGHEAGRPPWMETLPGTISLLDVLADGRSADTDKVGQRITIGMIDDPAAQDQYPAHVDLEAGGALAIFGNGGSGKTTLLKTVAVSAAARDSALGGGNLTIFGLDFASRELGLLGRLPQCEAIAMGDDLEHVTRILTILEQQLSKRRGVMAAAASRGEEPPEFSRILFLIDGFDNLVQTFEGSSNPGAKMHLWAEAVARLIVDGRQVGINTVFAAGRRGAVRSNIMAAVSNRLVLRQSDESSYMELGIPSKMARGLELDPGQGFLAGDQMIQIASLFGLGDGDDPADDRGIMFELADHLSGHTAPELCTQALPEEVGVLDTADLAGQHERTVRLGLAELSLAPVDVDLTFNNMVVNGPPRSGRSTALRTIAQQLADRGEEIWVFGQKGSPLASFSAATCSAFGRPADLVPVLEKMAAAVEAEPGVVRVLLFDDVDMIDDRSMYAAVQQLLDANVRCVGSVSSLRGFGQNPLYLELKAARTLLLLQPEGPRDVQEVAGVMPDLRPGLRMPVGCGVVVADRIATVVQVSSRDVIDVNVVEGPADVLTPLPAERLDTATLFRLPILERLTVVTEVGGEGVLKVDELVHAVDVDEDLTSVRSSFGEVFDEARAQNQVPSHSDPVLPSLCLEIAGGNGLESFDITESFEITESTILGRRPRSAEGHPLLTIDDPLVSSVHLQARPLGDLMELVDLGSLNGTIVHADEQSDLVLVPGEAVLVEPGARVYLGDTIVTIGILAASTRSANHVLV